jgi:hypothetical protein
VNISRANHPDLPLQCQGRRSGRLPPAQPRLGRHAPQPDIDGGSGVLGGAQLFAAVRVCKGSTFEVGRSSVSRLCGKVCLRWASPWRFSWAATRSRSRVTSACLPRSPHALAINLGRLSRSGWRPDRQLRLSTPAGFRRRLVPRAILRCQCWDSGASGEVGPSSSHSSNWRTAGRGP